MLPSPRRQIPGDVLRQNNWDEATCVLRLRYNISTADYDGWGLNGKMVDSKLNGDDASPQNNPEGDFIGLNSPSLQDEGVTAGSARSTSSAAHVAERQTSSKTRESRCRSLSPESSVTLNFIDRPPGIAAG